MKATGGTSNSLVRQQLKVGPIHTRQEIHDHEQPKAKHPCTPTTPARRSWRHGLADAQHGASRSPNTEKSHNRRGQTAQVEPKPQHTEIKHQNKAKHTGRAKAPTHTHRTGQKTRGGPKPHHTENPKYQPHGKHKNRPTRKGEEERKTKRKNKKAKESKGKHRDKEGREEEKTQTGRPREEAKIKAWLHGPITAMVSINKEI